MIVVDTSVLISYLRGDGTRGAEILHELEARGTPYSIPALCCQELLQGAADEAEWDLLEEHLSTQRLLTVESGWDTHRDAARIYFDCRRRGITIRSMIDCLIAQIVLDADGILLHEDDDYERIREVRPLRTLTGSSPGS